MSPTVAFPPALNHPTPNLRPNLRPNLGWLDNDTTAMPTHLTEGTFNAFGEGGHYAILDAEGEFITEIWVDAIPGLDMYAQH
jgi:hypothetical protein